MDIKSIQSCLQHITAPEKPGAKGVIPWYRNLLQLPSGCLVLDVIGWRHQPKWVPGKFCSERIARMRSRLLMLSSILMLSINSCILLLTHLILKTSLINGCCFARAKICLLTHFQPQRNSAPCWGPSCNNKQWNVCQQLPHREINLKFWARVISCFAWHFTATQHVPCTPKHWSYWNEYRGGNRDAARARIPLLWRQAGELRVFTWRRLWETLETLPVPKEAPSELERD